MLAAHEKKRWSERWWCSAMTAERVLGVPTYLEF